MQRCHKYIALAWQYVQNPEGFWVLGSRNCVSGLRRRLDAGTRDPPLQQKNPFALVDGLMEPFRPIVDKSVRRLWIV
jgi:hypothetical protein